jgi:hypothetical protein
MGGLTGWMCYNRRYVENECKRLLYAVVGWKGSGVSGS